jgi:hypothetical protein
MCLCQMNDTRNVLRARALKVCRSDRSRFRTPANGHHQLCLANIRTEYHVARPRHRGAIVAFGCVASDSIWFVGSSGGASVLQRWRPHVVGAPSAVFRPRLARARFFEALRHPSQCRRPNRFLYNLFGQVVFRCASACRGIRVGSRRRLRQSMVGPECLPQSPTGARHSRGLCFQVGPILSFGLQVKSGRSLHSRRRRRSLRYTVLRRARRGRSHLSVFQLRARPFQVGPEAALE